MGEYPKLRNVEAIPTEVNGGRALCLRDPANYSESVFFVPLQALEIIRYFDGRHSILDIQAEYVRRHGELLFREKVEEIIATLDQHHFLESERFEQYRRRICGLSPVYVLLHLVEGETGNLLHYGQWPDPQGTVTFCSVAFPA